MVKSMTGYSRLSYSAEWGSLTVEIQSVNRRYLEISCFLPKEWIAFDAPIKKQVQKELLRGKANVYLSYMLNEGSCVVKKTPNVQLAKDFQQNWQVLAKLLSIKLSDESLIHLLEKQSSLFQAEYDLNFTDRIKVDIETAIEKALLQLQTMREQEGAFLLKDLLNRISALEELLKKATSLSKDVAATIAERLSARVGELLESKIENDERFLKEIVLLADKSDIHEELVRIESHLELFKKELKSSSGSIGKKLDFISQELNREWNTIGSKCVDHGLSHLVIEAKSECEKIREQVQNIE